MDIPTPEQWSSANLAVKFSSIGIDRESIFSYSELKTDFLKRMASAFRQPILVQQFVHGYEVEVPAFPYPEPTCPAAVGIEFNGQKLLGDAVLTNSAIIEADYGFYDFLDINSLCAESLKSMAENLPTLHLVYLGSLE